jgi:integrase
MASSAVPPSSSTLNTYKRSISQIRKAIAPGTPENNFDFLAQHDAICSWIDGSDYKPNSRKTFYISLVSKLKSLCLLDDPAMLEAAGIYRGKMDDLNAKIQSKTQDQELSEAEKAKYLEWPQILETLEKIRLAVDDVESFQDYLIICLYTLMPPVRLDFAEMRIVEQEPTEHGANYLVWPNASGTPLAPYFLFTDYKTYKVYGAQRTPLPPALYDVVKEWIALADPEYLLTGSNGLPMKEWELGQTIISVFEKHSGKKVGANILRHSYISWMRKGEMEFKKSQELAQAMGHSQTMSALYRKI